MDCQMPVMDGYEATRRIRQLRGPAASTPIIAMTAAALESDQRRAEEVGMDDYIAKPVKVEDLRSTLDRWTSASSPHATSGEEPPGSEEEAEGAVEDTSAAGADAEPILDRVLLGQLQELDAATGASPSFVEEFLSNSLETFEKLQASLAEGDVDAVALQAHTLKGNLATLGARRASARAAELEALGPEWAGEEARDLLGRLATELDRVAVELGHPQASAATRAHPPGDEG
jgi:HPt (histidine-containing phosphotransfer) domain-containing protein